MAQFFRFCAKRKIELPLGQFKGKFAQAKSVCGAERSGVPQTPLPSENPLGKAEGVFRWRR